MQSNKKIMPEANELQANNSIPNSIIAQGNTMPVIIGDTMKVLNDLFPDAEYNCKLNILLAKMAQMVSFKRICFHEVENIKLINHYAINFMPSGMGKDRICNDLDNFVLKNFILYFKDKAKDYVKDREIQIEQEASHIYADSKQLNKKESYIQAQKEQIRELDLEINNATPEGFFADAKALKEADFGSLFVKLSEFGLFLQKGRQEDLLFFSSLFEAYDGKISSKSIKYGKREASIDNMPVNILLHSDYSLFKADIQGSFNLLMQIGLARRAFISFQRNNVQGIEKNSKIARERQEKAYSKANRLSEKIIDLFMSIPDKAIYKLTDEAHDNIFHPYSIRIKEFANQNHENELINKEIRSRELKVLKLAGMFACLNHPKDLTINETDVNQAITTVEQLSKDFKKFIDYKPKVNDSYEILFAFFIENLDQSFNKTTLINKYRDFGFRRDTFRKDFEEILEVISEMANEQGYYLKNEPINNNSGKAITLVKSEIGTSLPQEVRRIDEIV